MVATSLTATWAVSPGSVAIGYAGRHFSSAVVVVRPSALVLLVAFVVVRWCGRSLGAGRRFPVVVFVAFRCRVIRGFLGGYRCFWAAGVLCGGGVMETTWWRDGVVRVDVVVRKKLCHSL